MGRVWKYGPALLAILAGCSGSSRSDVDMTATHSDDMVTMPATDIGATPSADMGLPPAPDMAMPTNDGPVILSFGTNVTQLTFGETIRFVAVLTHPAGLDHLVGGHLSATSQNVQYGAFQATTQGSYQLDLTWAQINQAVPITFTAEEQRTFVAQFFDLAGHSTTQSVVIRLHCGGKAACDGVCTDLSTDNNNCGVCGAMVAPPRVCIGGQPACATAGLTYCPSSNICVDVSVDAGNCGMCDNVCASNMCIFGGCYSSITESQVPQLCNQVCSAAMSPTCVGGLASYSTLAVEIGCTTLPSNTIGAATFLYEDCYCR